MGANEGSEHSLKAPVLRTLCSNTPMKSHRSLTEQGKLELLYLVFQRFFQTSGNGWILRGFSIGTTSRYSLSNLWLSLQVSFISPQVNSLNKGRSCLIRLLRRASID